MQSIKGNSINVSHRDLFGFNRSFVVGNNVAASYDYEYEELLVYRRNLECVESPTIGDCESYEEVDIAATFAACTDVVTQRQRTREWEDSDDAMVCRDGQESVM